MISNWLSLAVSLLTLTFLLAIVVFVYGFARRSGKAFVGFLEHIIQEKRYNQYNYYDMPIRTDIHSYLFQLEREFNIQLTPEARNLLTEPIVEFYRSAGRRYQSPSEYQVWQQSLSLIIKTALDEPSDVDRYRRTSNSVPVRGSISIFNAIQLRWCNIPPFCRAT